MDAISKDALQKNRLKLLEDLTPTYIVDYLYQYKVLHDEDLSKFEKMDDKTKIRYILTVLPKRGEHAYQHFIDGLRYDDSYYWLADDIEETRKELLHNYEKTDNSTGEGLRNILTRGGVPELLSHHVKRQDVVSIIRSKLQNMADHPPKWLFLHGMVGIGKSTLAAEAVSDFQTVNKFSGNVFWVACGQFDEATILMKMQVLCERLDKELRNFVASNVYTASARLRELFTRSEYGKSLLILDDVMEDEDNEGKNRIIEAFNVGVRVMATTRYPKVVDNSRLHHELVEVPHWNDGQSKELLSKCAKKKMAELPGKADDICTLCRGNPMLLAMVGSDVGRFPEDEDRWDVIYANLRRRRRSTAQSNEEIHEIMKNAVTLSLNNLKESMRNYYNDLAVFINDVKIPRQVLAVLWDVDVHKATTIMYEFEQRSLATKEWNEVKKTYYYGIHDLHLDYLHRENEPRMKELHNKLVTQYEKKCGRKWENLPNDGYVHWYLGHHLNRAGRFDLFPDIYLNLKYVIQKLKITGPSDLTYDYNRYGKKYSKQHSDELLNFKSFVSGNAHLLSEKGCDALQLALCQTNTSAVYKQAIEIVLESKEGNRLYFNWEYT